jgi:integrase/recombinase XerD
MSGEGSPHTPQQLNFGDDLPTNGAMQGREAVNMYLLSRSYAPTSERQRRSILTRFCDVFDPEHGDAEAFLRWWASTAELKPASRRASLMAVRGFLRFCVSAGIRSDDPSQLVRMPKVPKRDPLVLTAEEVDRLRSVVAGTELELAVALMLDCGLRRDEVTHLPTDALVDGDWLRVTGKGGRAAMIPASRTVVNLWPTDGGELWPWSSTTLHDRVKRAMAVAGIGPEHSCHSLRRTCGTEMARRGVPLAVVSAVLRHEGLTSLHHYVAVGRGDMRRAVA